MVELRGLVHERAEKPKNCVMEHAVLCSVAKVDDHCARIRSVCPVDAGASDIAIEFLRFEPDRLRYVGSGDERWNR